MALPSSTEALMTNINKIIKRIHASSSVYIIGILTILTFSLQLSDTRELFPLYDWSMFSSGLGSASSYFYYVESHDGNIFTTPKDLWLNKKTFLKHKGFSNYFKLKEYGKLFDQKNNLKEATFLLKKLLKDHDSISISIYYKEYSLKDYYLNEKFTFQRKITTISFPEVGKK